MALSIEEVMADAKEQLSEELDMDAMLEKLERDPRLLKYATILFYRTKAYYYGEDVTLGERSMAYIMAEITRWLDSMTKDIQKERKRK